jgi:hypothetical protein
MRVSPIERGRREYDQRPRRAQNRLENKSGSLSPGPRAYPRFVVAAESKPLFHVRNKKVVAVITQDRPRTIIAPARVTDPRQLPLSPMLVLAVGEHPLDVPV